MRVLLVRPPVPKHTIGLKSVMLCEPLELEYVAAGLDGHDVRIHDMLLERGLDRVLREFRPHVVGTSSYIAGVNEARKVCRRVKAWNRECWTVVGGVQASRVPEDFLDPAVDCIVPGDGTTVMPEILAAIEGGTPLDEVPGLALPDGDRLHLTAARPYMPRPDTLPFPRRDLTARLRQRYYYLFHQPVTTMKTAWGCWYKCNFCYTWRITDGQPFARGAESVVEELARIESRDVYIVDDIFLINPRRLGEIGDLMRRRGIRKKILCYGRADFIAEHEEVIAEWADLGLSAVLIGLESASDSELDAMDKESSVDFNRRAVEVLRRHGVDTYGSLITQPDWLPAEWERLWRFIDDAGLYYLNISPLTPQPGTVIWEQYRDRVLVPREAHGLWDFSHMLLPTRMPLKAYYRALLRTYARTCLDIRRANRLTLRTRPPVLSPEYLRLWSGAFRIFLQFWNAHRHHSPRELARAMDLGPPVRDSGPRWRRREGGPEARRAGAEATG